MAVEDGLRTRSFGPTTRDLDEAGRLCGRITILDGGRTVAEDGPAGLIAAEAIRTSSDATLHDVFMTYTGRSLHEECRGRRRWQI
jgi:ABC-type multidrug transport system ATPase subunit